MAQSYENITMIGDPGNSANQQLIQSAGQLVDCIINQDRSYPELANLLGVTSSALPTVSGHMEHDYPSLATPSVGLADLPLLTPVKKVPLPPELIEQFGHMQCNCMMGVFPEVTRAWLTIDTDIFLWNYEDGSDLAYFDGLNDTILSAGLILPKPDIFRPHIRFLMCLATPVEIVLLGVSFSKPHEDADPTDFGTAEMHLLPDPLFSIPSDNIHMLSVKGDENGRIFMAGKDGCLYELVYQAQDGWFSRKCRKVNHSSSSLSYLVPSFLSFSAEDSIAQIVIDNSRKILYTRSQKGMLSVYDMGHDGQSMSRVVSVADSTILRQAIATARTIDKTHFMNVVHIAVIPRTESRVIHLVAVTHSGVRLYFTTVHFEVISHYASKLRPGTLSLVHVRLPPGFTANASPHRPDKIHVAHCSKGNAMLCGSPSEDSDFLWCLSPDAFPFQTTLMETQVSFQVDSKTWIIAEVPSRPMIDYAIQTSRGPRSLLPPEPNPPSVVEQHTTQAARYVLLSSQGSHLVTRLRPVDQLRQFMLNNGGHDCPAVENFFRLHMEDQAIATCLILACSQVASDAQVSEWATQAFFLFGGEARMRSSLDQTPAANLGPMFGSATPLGGQAPYSNMTVGSPSALAQNLGPNVASTPYDSRAMPQTPYRQQFGDVQHDVEYSGRFKGLCLYFGRIVRFLWENKLLFEVGIIRQAKENCKVLDLAFEKSELSWVMEEVKALKSFMQRHSQLSAVAEGLMTPGPSQMGYMRPDSVLGHRPGSQLQREHDQHLREEAHNFERQSLVSLYKLVTMTAEVLALLQLLCYHQFHIVIGTLSKDIQDQLRIMTLRDLVLDGSEICSCLINALINRYIGDHSTTDSISSRLRELCPSLYSKDDAICMKGAELLKAGMTSQTRSVKNDNLKESLELFKLVSQQLNLQAVCQDFHQARFYDGIVDLCLSASSKGDPSNLALHYYQNGKPPNDVQGLHAFTARYECYRSTTDILDELLATANAPRTSPVPSRSGPPPTPDPNRLTKEEAEMYLEEMMRKCLSSTDELFHVAFYDWLVNNGLKERLLAISTPYVEPYLQRATQYSPEDLQMVDLLWMYYEKTKNFPAAARILSKLAERRTTDLTLQQRIEYLSRAVVCTKSSSLRTSSAKEGEFLHDLEEKLEVAQLQLQVFEAITKYHHLLDPQVQDALAQLNSELVDITKLYGDFADPFELSDCKLAIVFCADHYDNELVQSLWQEIFDKEFTHNIGKSPSVCTTILSKKLIAYGKQYMSSERYFPLVFLVNYLEKRSCELEWEERWIFSSLLHIGISMQRLHATYDQLFKAKNSFWQTSRNPFHLLNVIFLLLSTFTDKPSTVSGMERRQFVTLCLDSVAGYKVELEATTGRSQDVQALLSRFAQLQIRLERMLKNP